jgi:hypothetical protein
MDGGFVTPTIRILPVMFRDHLPGRPAPTVVTIVQVAVVPELGDVTDGADVHVGMLQQLFEVRDPLTSRADDRHVELIAGRNSPGAAQNPLGNNAGHAEHCGGTEEPPPRQQLIGLHSSCE